MSEKISTQQIAATFVQKYYNCLTKDVQNIGTFYKEQSTYTFGNSVIPNHAEHHHGIKVRFLLFYIT
jgi:hypothetical protein